MILVLVSLAAAVWIYRLTDRGIGIGSDSAVYIAGARNLLDGNGFVWPGGDGLPRPINHYPPYYSAMLAAGMGLGLTAEDAARGLNALLMGASTFLVGMVAGLLAASGMAAVLAALLFAISEEPLAVYSWAMSDGLYLFLALLCVTSATWTLRHPSARLARGGMWISAGLAFLTRYAGVALIAVPLTVTLYERKHQRSRPGAVVAWLLLALIPGLAWMARNVALTGSATNRRFVWSPVDPGWWQHLGEVVGEWIVPGRIVRVLQTSHIPTGLAALAFVCLIVAAARVGSRGSDGRPVLGWEWIPLLAWLGGHVALLVVSTATGYPPPDIDTRTLAPVFAGLLILLAASLVLAGTTAPSWIRGAAIVVAIGLLVFKGYAARDLIQRLARDGQGYTSAAWSNSAALEALVRAEPGVVYADDTGAVYYFTGRPAFQVPVRFDPVTGEERPSYRSEVCLMRTRLREDEGLLVLFGSEATGRPPGDSDDLLRGLEPVVEGPGGAVFRDGSGTLHECDSARLRERGPALARVPMTPEGAG